MNVKRIERTVPNSSRVIKTHRNCNLTMGDGRIDLSGKGFGFIATGLIRNVSTSYRGSQFQLRVVVMRHISNTKYTLEEWYIEF